MVHLGKVVHMRRRLLKISQIELADMAGLNRTYISDVERGTRCPSITVVRSIAKALDMSAGTLIEMAELSELNGTRLKVTS